MRSKDYYVDILEKAVAEIEYSDDPVELYEPIRYILSIGGKRLRPLVTLMSCDFFGGDVKKAIMPAIGIEIFHNFTLVHDDIMDHAETRRGNICVHKKWDENRAILSGDAMLILANTYMLKVDDDVLREVMTLYNYYGLKVCEGQQYDLNFEKLQKVSIDEYIKMIDLKTAALMAAAFRLGAVIAKASEQNKNLFEQFGYYLGIAFQIEDDYLDVFGNYSVFGKRIGGDILTNKKTFLLLKAYEVADEETKNEISYWYSGTEFDPGEKIAAITEIFRKLRVKDFTEEASEYYYKKSLEYLNKIDVQEKNKRLFSEFAHSLVKRTY